MTKKVTSVKKRKLPERFNWTMEDIIIIKPGDKAIDDSQD